MFYIQQQNYFGFSVISVFWIVKYAVGRSGLYSVTGGRLFDQSFVWLPWKALNKRVTETLETRASPCLHHSYLEQTTHNQNFAEISYIPCFVVVVKITEIRYQIQKYYCLGPQGPSKRSHTTTTHLYYFVKAEEFDSTTGSKWKIYFVSDSPFIRESYITLC